MALQPSVEKRMRHKRKYGNSFNRWSGMAAFHKQLDEVSQLTNKSCSCTCYNYLHKIFHLLIPPSYSCLRSHVLSHNLHHLVAHDWRVYKTLWSALTSAMGIVFQCILPFPCCVFVKHPLFLQSLKSWRKNRVVKWMWFCAIVELRKAVFQWSSQNVDHDGPITF